MEERYKIFKLNRKGKPEELKMTGLWNNSATMEEAEANLIDLFSPDNKNFVGYSDEFIILKVYTK